MGEKTELATDPLLSNVPVHEGYKVLGGVVLCQKLGQGGMGAVYKGRHLRLDIDVALKVTALPAGTPPEHAAGFLRRFIREARTAAAVRHPNLIRVYDVNAEGSVHYLIMDYVDGESAADRLERKGRLSEQEAVEICLGAAEGLAAAHSQGIVHRDVKPDNILIGKKGSVVVADLGLAKAYAVEGEGARPTTVTQTGVALGTPHYMSPEQFTPDRGVGPASDVWSLGVTLYQLLTTRLPWTGANVFEIADNVRKRKLPDPKESCESLPDGVCRIVRKATQKKTSRRYADCGEMAKALRKHVDAIRTSPENVLADAKAGATKMVLVSVTPPDARTMTLIGEAALGPERAPAREVRVDEVIEKRMDLEERVDRFEREEPDADEEALAEIRKHLRIAEAAEGKDTAAALARLAMAEKVLVEQREAIEKAKAEEARAARRDVFDAVNGGDVEKVRAILRTDPGLVDARDGEDHTPLTWACHCGRSAVAEMLIEAGADVNARVAGGATPLFFAAGSGMFVARGANNFMKQRKPNMGDCIEDQLGLVKLLLLNGAQVNAGIAEGYAPLTLAVWGAPVEIVEFLLKQGAEANVRDVNGFTVLRVAASGASVDKARLLLNYGADVNARGDQGEVPLHLAAEMSTLEMVELLLAEEADVNVRSKEGKTPLDLAVEEEREDVADLLREHGGRRGAELTPQEGA